MKRLISFILLFFACFSLFAQNFREARVFISPVGGSAGKEDKAFFYQKLVCESLNYNYEFVRSRRNCEFILRGYIIPFSEFMSLIDEMFEEGGTAPSPVPAQSDPPVRNTKESREFFSWEVDDSVHFYDSTGEENYLPLSNWSPEDAEAWRALRATSQGNVFFLELVHKEKDVVLSVGFLVYQSRDTFSGDELSVMVRNMISDLPKIEEVDNWRHRWLFLEASALWAPRIYSNEGSSSNINNYGFRLSAELHFTNFMSISAGAQITQDFLTISGTDEEYHDLILEVPAALKLVLKPADYFSLEPYGGISFNFSLLGITEPSFMSWFAGLQFGIKAGAGMVVIDPRFSMDLGNSGLDGGIEYQRTCIYLGVGYKIGLIPKRPIRLEY